jgi:hypothetical protein
MQDQTIILGNPLEWFRFCLALGVLISLFSGIALFYLQRQVRFLVFPLMLVLAVLFVRSDLFLYTTTWESISQDWTGIFGPSTSFVMFAILFGMGCFVGHVAMHSEIAKPRWLERY